MLDAAGPMPGATPPVGSSPVAKPSPSPGSDAAAMALVQQAVKILQEAASKIDVSSDLGQAVLKSVETLGKHAPPQMAAQGVEQQALRNLTQQARAAGPFQALQRQMQTPSVATPPTGGSNGE